MSELTTDSSNINNLDDNKYIEYCKLFSSFLYVKDIDGVGSVMFHMKHFKPKKIKKQYDEFTQYVMYTCLKALNISKQNGWGTIRAYVNLNYCSMDNFSLKIFKHINGLTSTAFPDTLDTCFICSTTKMFKILWGMVFKIIDAETRQKFKLVDDFSFLFDNA
jgi:hypothetical protein|tara:strand:- start:354 stop:839 length:486 start_codon:yes stop_codon:yes gene_type:complete